MEFKEEAKASERGGIVFVPKLLHDTIVEAVGGIWRLGCCRVQSGRGVECAEQK